MSSETSNAPAKQAAATTDKPAKMTPFQAFTMGLKSRRQSYAGVLPGHLKAERFMRSAMVAVTRNPMLLECTSDSMWKSLQEAAVLGLEVSGLLGSAYLVPFYNGRLRAMECQLIPGYRGLIGLARQSGEVETIDAFAVYEGDEWKVEFGTDPKIHHVPKLDGSDRGKIVGAYAVAKIVGGGRQFVFMPISDILKIRNNSPGYQASVKKGFKSPWTDHEEAMVVKTPVRRLMKFLPLSVEKLIRALELGDASEKGEEAAPDTLDVDGFSKILEDSEAAAKADGALGEVARSVEREPGQE